jgi:hypothetical protein
VLTFPPPVLGDPDRYRSAAVLDPPSEATVDVRRALALDGLRQLIEGGPDTLAVFYEQAAALVRPRLGEWRATWLETVAVQAAHTSSALDALAAGDGRHLRDAAVFSAPRSVTAGWGMCGRLGTHDVRNPPGRRVFLNGDAPYHRRDC